eukprot:2874711-Prorocentrum_lima.AAC.1
MTSSLVGSEMCIRDRESPLGKYPCRGLGSRRRGREGGYSQCVYIINKGAVSYTHLTLPTICSV